MIKQAATVTACEADVVWVEAQRESTCGQCQLRKGCGTGLLAEHVGKRFSRLAVSDTTQGFSPGQQVQLEIAESALVKGAFLMYIIPLLFLFIFAAITKILNLGELMGIVFGLGGLLIGFYLIKKRLRKHQNTVRISKTKIGEEINETS